MTFTESCKNHVTKNYRTENEWRGQSTEAQLIAAKTGYRCLGQRNQARLTCPACLCLPSLSPCYEGNTEPCIMAVLLTKEMLTPSPPLLPPPPPTNHLLATEMEHKVEGNWQIRNTKEANGGRSHSEVIKITSLWVNNGPWHGCMIDDSRAHVVGMNPVTHIL